MSFSKSLNLIISKSLFPFLILLFIYSFIPLFSPHIFAQGSGGCEVQGAATFGCLETIFAKAVKALVELAGAVLFIMLVVGGFKFLFSGGDQKKLESAKGTITNAIIGLVVIAVAFLILKTIDVFVFNGNGTVTQFSVGGQ